MTEGFALSSADRLLVLAPHPDDESLASGGLIQQALAAGASLRVVIATDGDNNPWPQRWAEKRWRIDAAARARWGARRRDEARAALRVLGAPADAATFFGWPDLGLTAALLQRPQALLQPLRETWREFAPTHVVLPLARDTHPDHSALHLLARAAARSLDARPLGLAFAVHGGRDGGDIVLPLDRPQFERKREAVLQHTSQTVLGRGRLLRFVQPQETFTAVHFQDAPRAEQRDVAAAEGNDRVLLVGIGRDGRLYAASDDPVTDMADRHVAGLFDLHTGERIAASASPEAAMALPPSWRDVAELWTKRERRSKGLLVFDRQGWQSLLLPPSA